MSKDHGDQKTELRALVEQASRGHHRWPSRRFLVEGFEPETPSLNQRLGWLSSDPAHLVEVQVHEDTPSGILKISHHARIVLRQQVPLEAALAMLAMCPLQIERERWVHAPIAPHGQPSQGRWLIDRYNFGDEELLIARQEGPTAECSPDFLREEVTDDPRYRSGALAISRRIPGKQAG